MAKDKKQETAPEVNGAVLNNEAETTAEVVIEEVIKDSLDAVKAEVNDTIVEEQKQGVEEAKERLEAEEKARLEAEENVQKEDVKVFKYKNASYAFVENTPNTLALDEGIFSQKEILSNKELMQSLIDNNCIFIKQV